MNAQISLYTALVEAGVPEDKARDVVIANDESVVKILETLMTKESFAANQNELRTYIDGRFNTLDERLKSQTNSIVIRLGALVIALTGILTAVSTFFHH